VKKEGGIERNYSGDVVKEKDNEVEFVFE